MRAEQAGPLVVCVGDLMVDVRAAAPALARGGDVAGAVSLHPGGAAANVAVWARAAGARARLVARRGDDLAGRLVLAALAERGVELHPEAPHPGPTGAMLVMWEAGERSFVADPGANLALRTRDVRGGLDGAAAVYVSGYALVRPASRRAALTAAGHGGMAAVDAGSWPLLVGGARDAVLAAAAKAGTLLANGDEATALCGVADPERAAAVLAGRVGVVVVKLGERGVLVAAGGRLASVPAAQAVAVDVTGAGDAFAAGWLVAAVRGAEPVEAARAGVEHAARAIAVEGAWPPL